MKLNLEELERAGLEKEAFLDGLINKLPGVSQAQELQKGLSYVTGGGIIEDIGNAAMKFLPLAMSLGGKGKSPIPQMPKFSRPLVGPSGTVGTFANMSKAGEKRGSLLDMGMLRTILTARTANGIIDSAQGKNLPSVPASGAPSSSENSQVLELTSKYPEINKMLADPQSRAYLESLLTKDISHGP